MFTGIGNPALTPISAGLPTLITLNLSDCHRITGDGVGYMSARLTSLTRLNISDNGRVSGHGFYSIAGLHTLCLRYCQNVTDIEKICAKFPALTWLDISRCERLTFNSLHLDTSCLRGLSYPRGLSYLDIRGCPLVRNSGLDRQIRRSVPLCQILTD